MCRTVWTLCGVVMMTLVFAQIAAAQDEGYGSSGTYISLGAGYAQMTRAENELEDLIGGIDVDVTASVAIDFRAGYRFNPRVAGEIQFQLMPDFGIEAEGVDVFDITSVAILSNLRLFILTGRVQPYVLVGAGLLATRFEDTVGLGFDENFSGFAFNAGGGVEYYITQSFALDLGANYLYPTGDVEFLDYFAITGSLAYHF